MSNSSPNVMPSSSVSSPSGDTDTPVLRMSCASSCPKTPTSLPLIPSPAAFFQHIYVFHKRKQQLLYHYGGIWWAYLFHTPLQPVSLPHTAFTGVSPSRVAHNAVEKRVGDDIAVEPATPLFSFDGIAPDSPIPKIGHFISRFGHCLSPPLPQQQKQATTRILRWNRSRSTSRSVGE